VKPALAFALLLAVATVIGLVLWLSTRSGADAQAPAATAGRRPDTSVERRASNVDKPVDDLAASTPSAAPEREARGAAANAPQRGPTGSLVVRAVWTSTGAPAVNVGVRLQRENGPLGLIAAQTKTDASGIARFASVDAVPMLVFGDRAGEARVLVAPGASNEVELALPAGATVTGRVTDPNGRSVSNAQIWIRRSEDDYWLTLAECDSAGRYRVEHVPSGYLIATARELAPSKAAKIAGANVEALQHDFTLGGAATSVLGQILESDDQTVPGAMAALAHSELGFFAAISDDEGRFAHHGVSLGAALLSVSSARFAPTSIELDVALDNRNEHIVRLEPGAELSGVVTLDGAPVEDARVVIRGSRSPGERWGEARTDAQGRYRLSGLPHGSHVALASRPIRAPKEGLASQYGDIVSTHGQVELVAGRTVIWNAELKRDE
jgi:hypothetical protein